MVAPRTRTGALNYAAETRKAVAERQHDRKITAALSGDRRHARSDAPVVFNDIRLMAQSDEPVR
jgi:hypothetical protein